MDGYKQVKGDKRSEKNGKAMIVAVRGTDFRSGKDLRDGVGQWVEQERREAGGECAIKKYGRTYPRPFLGW